MGAHAILWASGGLFAFIFLLAVFGPADDAEDLD